MMTGTLIEKPRHLVNQRVVLNIQMEKLQNTWHYNLIKSQEVVTEKLEIIKLVLRPNQRSNAEMNKFLLWRFVQIMY